jgi:hypothetical protein
MAAKIKIFQFLVIIFSLNLMEILEYNFIKRIEELQSKINQYEK